MDIAYVYILIGGGLSFFINHIENSNYKKELEKYEMAKADFEKYKQCVITDEDRRIQIELNAPKCPHCSSSNIQKITLSSKAVKTAMLGTLGAMDDAGKPINAISADINGKISSFATAQSQSQGIAKLDYLVLTHPDSDHIGGAPVIITKFEIDKVFILNFIYKKF